MYLGIIDENGNKIMLEKYQILIKLRKLYTVLLLLVTSLYLFWSTYLFLKFSLPCSKAAQNTKTGVVYPH